MFRSICITIFRGLAISTLCSHQIGVRCCKFVVCLFVQYAAICGRIRPHTAQTHNKSTATESNLVTAQSTDREPPEDGHRYGPKHVGGTSLKCF